MYLLVPITPPPHLHTPSLPQSSLSPCYSHLVLLDLGPSCPLAGAVEFEVFSVNHTNMEMCDCNLEGRDEYLEGVVSTTVEPVNLLTRVHLFDRLTFLTGSHFTADFKP